MFTGMVVNGVKVIEKLSRLGLKRFWISFIRSLRGRDRGAVKI